MDKNSDSGCSKNRPRKVKQFCDIGRISSVNLNGKTPEQAASFVINKVNEMVPNSFTRHCTPGLGKGEPLLTFLGTSRLKNSTDQYDKIIGDYRKKIQKHLCNNKDINVLFKKKLGLIAHEAMKTHCGDCEEMAYTGAFVLRNNGYQGNIKIMEYGPLDDEDADLPFDVDYRFLVAQKHCFLLLEGAPEHSDWVADIWAKKSFPYSEWRNHLKGYGNLHEFDGKVNEETLRKEGWRASLRSYTTYGYLIPPEKMPLEKPREDIKFSDFFPPLASDMSDKGTSS